MTNANRADEPSAKRTRLSARYGPWAVVTGASDGIGRAICERLAAAGIDLVLVARRGDALRALATALAERHGVATRVIVADLGTATGIDVVLADTAVLDVGLFVAAAGFGTAGRFLDGDLGDELAMVDVNCRAVVAMTHAFGRRFVARGRGGVVLFSSLLAFQGVPRAANYAATKAFVQSFAEGIRAELAPLGVDVVASAPGPIHSGFAARAGMVMAMGLPPEAVAQATLDALGRRTTVRPGWLSVFLEASLALLPRWGRVRVMALVMGGMTRHRTDRPARLEPRPKESA